MRARNEPLLPAAADSGEMTMPYSMVCCRLWSGGFRTAQDHTCSYYRQVTMRTPTGAAGPIGETQPLVAAACLFHGLSDPSRLAILRHLALGEHRVVDLTAHLDLAQSTVSKHLACLKGCGLVTSRPQGRASVFSLNHTDAVGGLLVAAERLLDLTGDAVTLCPTFGTATLEDA